MKILKIILQIIASALSIPLAFICITAVAFVLGWIFTGFSNNIDLVMEMGMMSIATMTVGGVVVLVVWFIWYVIFGDK